MKYKIKRLEDCYYLCQDKQGSYYWFSDRASFYSAATAGMILAELPNGMKDGFYKLIPVRKD